MIERVVENWLTSTNERGYEVPFCQLLLSQGYRMTILTGCLAALELFNHLTNPSGEPDNRVRTSFGSTGRKYSVGENLQYHISLLRDGTWRTFYRLAKERASLSAPRTKFPKPTIQHKRMAYLVRITT